MSTIHRQSPTSATAKRGRGRPARRCPRCGSTRAWSLASGRLRCAQCRYDWRPDRLPLQLTAKEWRAVLRWFVLDVPARRIAEETGLERKRVLRALAVVRRALAAQAGRQPEDGVQEEERRKVPVIGIAIVQGRGRAEVLPAPIAEEVRRAVRLKRASAPIPLSQPSPYAAAVYRGRFVRLAPPGSGGGASFGELEAFWGYLRQRLRTRSGVRRERLGLHVAEYAWRYNTRALTPTARTDQLMRLLPRSAREGLQMGLYPGRRAVDSAAESNR